MYLSYFWLGWVFTAARAFSGCSEWGSSPVAVLGLLIEVASLEKPENGLVVVALGLMGPFGSGPLGHGLNICGA